MIGSRATTKATPNLFGIITENCAKSFRGGAHLRKILEEAHNIVGAAFKAKTALKAGLAPPRTKRKPVKRPSRDAMNASPDSQFMRPKLKL